MNDKNRRILLLSPKTNAISIGIYLIILLIVPSFLYTYFDREIANNIKIILYIILAIMMAGTVLQYFLDYLEPKNTLKMKSEEPPLLKTVAKQIAELKDEVKNIGTVKIDVDGTSRNDLLESLKLSVDQGLFENVFKSIDQEFVKRDLQNKQWEGFIIGFDDIKNRLFNETNNLARRANLNLLLGAGTTILALVGLVGMFFLFPFDLKEYSKDNYGWAILAHYIPRFSLFIFTQVFAYFFLRLYKGGLEDIKYYQNEITNVELKISALKVALNSEENEILKTVVEELVKIERNFILKKDETTVELEKFKTESVSTKDLLTHINSLWNIKK